MNKLFLFSFVVASIALSTSFATKVLAAEYEELTYDDLVNQLSTKQEQANTKNRAPEIKNHLGLGIANTWANIVADGKTFRPMMNGFEISTGIDLNSEKIRGELGFRNFFQKTEGSETSSLREINMGMHGRSKINELWYSKMMGGFAIRQLRFDDGVSISIDDTSSMLFAGGGLEARLSSSVAIGGDISTRFPFGTATADRNSIDFGLKLDTTF